MDTTTIAMGKILIIGDSWGCGEWSLSREVVHEGTKHYLQEAGYKKFRVQPEHLKMWKSEDAKNPSKGFGADVSGYWYWYESWVERCIELCKAAGSQYK